MFETLLSWTVETYGGFPVVVIINSAQLTLFLWVLAQARAARREESMEPTMRRHRSLQRLEIWRRSVRPMVMTFTLLGPGVGLAMSTLLGALGMNDLSEAMVQQLSQTALMEAMSTAYREIAYAYLLMVGGTPPMLLGPVTVLAARALDERGIEARGGTPEERMARSLDSLLAATLEQNRLVLALGRRIAQGGDPS